MSEHQKRSYAVEITNDNSKKRIVMDTILENIDGEMAEKIISEMESVKERVKNIMAE